jgi:hypothetical protein
VLIRAVQRVLFAAAVFVATAMPAWSQSLGVGISFLGDQGGTGLIADYSKPYKTISGDRTLAWVGDFSIFHHGFGNDLVGVNGGLTTFMLQGGARLGGQVGEKVTWLGQGLIGFRHSRFGSDIRGLKDVCGTLDIDCSDSGGVLTIGGALQYALSETTGVRGQLDFPFALGGNGSDTTRVSIMLVWRRMR